MMTMKYTQPAKTLLLILAWLSFGGVLTSCDKNIELGQTDENKYITTHDKMGYLTNDQGKRSFINADFREEGSINLYLNSTQKTSQDCNATLKYDVSALNEYNRKQETDYEAMPENLITIEDNGVMRISSGNNKSVGIKLSYHTSVNLAAEKTYVIPLKVSSASSDLTISPLESSCLIFVKDKTKSPTPDKANGIKIISCMEMNDTNPLNNLCFTLKSTGQPLVDIVILFSANINYNTETGRVYINNNKHIQQMLNYREKYLKPLQDKGMKVVLGILGNHDHSGIANLADQTAQDFAKEIKATCDAYQLDGVFFDDEYSNYITPAPEGFVSPSRNAASRLCYETKKAMPDKLVCVYVYRATKELNAIDGHQPGEFIDYAIQDYGENEVISSGSYPGLSKAGMSLYSQEFRKNIVATERQLQHIRDNKYGAHMIFGMNPTLDNFGTQKSIMSHIARVLFNDELVYDERPYKKDW